MITPPDQAKAVAGPTGDRLDAPPPGETPSPASVPECRRPYPDAELSCYRLPLSQGKTALIDAADVATVAAYVWSWTTAYGSDRGRAVRRDADGKYIYLGRAVCGEPIGRVHYRHDDTLDCRRSNLQVRRRPLNGGQKKACGKSSVYKGVCFAKGKQRWKAYVCPGRMINLGYFSDERAAAEAYDAAAKEHFGDTARLNFPQVQ